MKYQKGLSETKRFLNESSEPKILELCKRAGLTDRETAIIIQKFRKKHQRHRIASDNGFSESRLSIRTTLILKILKSVLQEIGLIDKDF